MMGLVRTFIQHFTYVALVAVLVASGLGVPIPEDVPLVFSGYLCHPDASPMNVWDTDEDAIPDAPVPEARTPRVPNLYLMIVSGMVGVIAGDTIVFFVAHRGIDADNIVARHLRKILHSKWRERLQRHFQRHGYLTVFAGRFMPLLRSGVFALAGMSRMAYPRFILIDGCAALISVPTFILVGYYGGNHINAFFHFLERSKLIVALVLLAVALTAGVIYLIRWRRAKSALTPTEVG